MTPSRFPTVTRTLLVVPLMAVGLIGCGGAQEAVSEQLVEQTAGGEGVDVELGDDGQVASVETEDGSLEMSASGEVPEEWPDDVPLFEDGVVSNSQVATTDDGTIVSIDYLTDAGAESAYDAMVAAYKAAGFITTLSDVFEDKGGLATYIGERNGASITMMVDIPELNEPTGVILNLRYPAG